MNFTETAIVAAITLSVAGAAFVAVNPAALTHRAEVTAVKASCRAVEQAVLAYTDQRSTPPRMIADVRPYVRGDISDYRLVGGLVVGPGCDPGSGR